MAVNLAESTPSRVVRQGLRLKLSQSVTNYGIKNADPWGRHPFICALFALQLWTSGNQLLAFGVVGEALKVLNKALSQIVRFLIPLGGILIGIAWV